MFTDTDKKEIQILKTRVLQYYNKAMNELADPKITSVFYDNCIITGGCIASLYHAEVPNDIDLYAKDTKALKIIVDLIIEIRDVIKDMKTYAPDDLTLSIADAKCITNNAITLKNNVQLITLGTVDKCRKNFDFIHCMPWFDIKTQKLHISEAQFYSIKHKTLVTNPGAIIKDSRLEKYKNRGWATALPAGIIAQEVTAVVPEAVTFKS